MAYIIKNENWSRYDNEAVKCVRAEHPRMKNINNYLGLWSCCLKYDEVLPVSEFDESKNYTAIRVWRDLNYAWHYQEIPMRAGKWHKTKNGFRACGANYSAVAIFVEGLI